MENWLRGALKGLGMGVIINIIILIGLSLLSLTPALQVEEYGWLIVMYIPFAIVILLISILIYSIKAAKS